MRPGHTFWPRCLRAGQDTHAGQVGVIPPPALTAHHSGRQVWNKRFELRLDAGEHFRIGKDGLDMRLPAGVAQLAPVFLGALGRARIALTHE